MKTHADVIALGLPDDWQDVPIEPAEFETYLGTILAGLADAGVGRVERRRIELLQRQLRQLLAAEDVRYASVFAEPVAADELEDSSPPQEGDVAVLGAAAVVTVTDRSSLGAPGPLTAELLVRGVEGGEAVDLDPPSLVDLAAGRAARFARLQSASVGPGAPVEVLVQSYLVPFDDGERLCTLQLVTPNVTHGGEFSDLFDGIAGTLRIFREDDPATFSTSATDLTSDHGPGAASGEAEPEAR